MAIAEQQKGRERGRGSGGGQSSGARRLRQTRARGRGDAICKRQHIPCEQSGAKACVEQPALPAQRRALDRIASAARLWMQRLVARVTCGSRQHLALRVRCSVAHLPPLLQSAALWSCGRGDPSLGGAHSAASSVCSTEQPTAQRNDRIASQSLCASKADTPSPAHSSPSLVAAPASASLRLPLPLSPACLCR